MPLYYCILSVYLSVYYQDTAASSPNVVDSDGVAHYLHRHGAEHHLSQQLRVGRLGGEGTREGRGGEGGGEGERERERRGEEGERERKGRGEGGTLNTVCSTECCFIECFTECFTEVY